MRNQLTYGCKATPDMASGTIAVSEVYGGLAGDVDVCGECIERFVASVVNTREAEIRAALIAMGWTPPKLEAS